MEDADFSDEFCRFFQAHVPSVDVAEALLAQYGLNNTVRARSRVRLLLWGSLCFVFLTLNNLLLFFDFQFMEIDLRAYRLLSALAGLAFPLYGFIFESE